VCRMLIQPGPAGEQRYHHGAPANAQQATERPRNQPDGQ
jgi:hypothetical protein